MPWEGHSYFLSPGATFPQATEYEPMMEPLQLITLHYDYLAVSLAKSLTYKSFLNLCSTQCASRLGADSSQRRTRALDVRWRWNAP